jgi:hypothetical protein
VYYTWLKYEEITLRTPELVELSNYNLSYFSREMSAEGVDMPSNIQ